MKITYLAYTRQDDGSRALSVITEAEWDRIREENLALPRDQRRVFFSDVIQEGHDIDIMVIEMDRERFRRENSEKHNAAKKSRGWAEHPPLSLEQLRDTGESAAPGLDNLIADSRFERAVEEQLDLKLLRRELADWKPWACEMLGYYLAGESRRCTGPLARKYGVTERMMRNYKREFENFVKKFYF